MEENVNTENPDKSGENWRNADGTLKPGHPPLGHRPKGSGKGLKDYDRQRFANMSDEEKEEFLKEIAPELRYRMAEGNPATETEHKGEVKVQIIPGELIDKNEISISPEPILDSEEQNEI